MLIRLDNKSVVNTDYIVTLGVGSVEGQTGHHVVAQLISGQMTPLFMYDTKDAAEAKIDLLIKDHNLHHMTVDNTLHVKTEASACGGSRNGPLPPG